MTLRAITVSYGANSWSGTQTITSGNLVVSAGTITASGAIQSTGGNITANGIILNRSATNFGAILDNGDGIFRFYNGASTGFTGVQFGGTTNSFPYLVVDGAGLKITGAAGGVTAWFKTPTTTVASLPAAATAGAGARMAVSDATVTTFASVVVGGGANVVPVMSTGSSWIIA